MAEDKEVWSKGQEADGQWRHFKRGKGDLLVVV